MTSDISKWRRAAADRIREMLIIRGDAEQLRESLDKIVKDADKEIEKLYEALDKDGN